MPFGSAFVAVGWRGKPRGRVPKERVPFPYGEKRIRNGREGENFKKISSQSISSRRNGRERLGSPGVQGGRALEGGGGLRGARAGEKFGKKTCVGSQQRKNRGKAKGYLGIKGLEGGSIKGSGGNRIGERVWQAHYRS